MASFTMSHTITTAKVTVAPKARASSAAAQPLRRSAFSGAKFARASFKAQRPRSSFVIKAADGDEEVQEAEAKKTGEMLDPADGSVQYGGPMGDEGTENLNEFIKSFGDSRTIEVMNGRAAMIGFASALFFEFTKGASLVEQVFNIRTFTLLDGNEVTSKYPGAGLYLALLTALVVVVASYIPKAKGIQDNGLDVEPGPRASPLPRFTAENEMFNGRAAMVGLVALAVTEAILGRAEF